MGQAATKEHRHTNEDASSATPAHHYPSTVDGGALEPQGVYSGPHEYSHDVVKSAIVQRKLMPFYKGQDDEEAYSGQMFNTECPICFLYYPSALNQTRCCAQPICTECFVEIKRADPNHTNPPSSQPAECPFCTVDNFGIVFHKPNLSPVNEAEAESSAVITYSRRKSFAHTDPDVLTTDMIRPDWSQKLAAAQATILRRANRRIIMRQVGERLIPIGVSSSRVGAELPEGSGPGGAIILREGEDWGPVASTDIGARNRRSSRRGGASSSGMMQIAEQDVEEMMLMEAMRLSLLEHEEEQRRQSQQQQGQRQQGDTTNGALQGPACTVSSTDAQPVSPSTGSNVTITRSSSTSRGQPMPPASGRAKRLSQNIRNATPLNESVGMTPSSSSTTSGPSNSVQPTTRVSSSNASPPPPSTSNWSGEIIDFGLRDDVLGDLAELIDEPNDDMKRKIEATKAAKQAREKVAEDAAQQQHQYDPVEEARSSRIGNSAGSSRSQIVAPSTHPFAAGPGTTSPRLPNSATTSPVVSPPGSPSMSSRPLNPNNPFRSRLASSSGANSPVKFPAPNGHSRVVSHSDAADTTIASTGTDPSAPFGVSQSQTPWRTNEQQYDRGH